MDDTVAILGCGTMGEAIVAGLQRAGIPVSHATCRSKTRRELLAGRYPTVQVGHDNASAARAASVVVLASKPLAAGALLAERGVADALSGKLLISICAGVLTSTLAEAAPAASVIRAMPNTPCVIGEGMTVLAPGPGATEDHLARASRLFATVGRVRVLEEKHLDAVTGLSGSGPAFVCVVLESLADGGVRMGLPRDVALELAAQATLGAAKLVLTTGRHPAALKDEVTTPAGCTIAGLLIMEDGRIRSTLARTIEEATRVAAGLGKPKT